MRVQWIRAARWAAPALVGVAALVPFLPALGGALLGWDDRRALLDFTGWRSLGWSTWRWAFTTLDMGMYRPLTWLSYAFDHALTGLAPSGFHRTNLLVHGAVAALAFAALRRFGRLAEGAEPPALAAALVTLAFAVHPLRVQVVAWVSARADALAALFLLAAALAFLRWLEGGRWGWRAAWHGLFALSLLAKPVALGAPVAFAVAGLWLRRNRGTPRAPGAADLALGLGASAAVAVPLALAKGVVRQGGGVPELPPSAAFTALHNAVQPLWKTAWPSGLGVAEPAYPFEPFEVAYVGGALLALALGALVWHLRHRAPGVAATAVAWLALLAPVLGVVPFGYELTADRFSYVPSLALLPGALWLAGRVPAPRAAAAAGVALLCGWSAVSWVRCGDWASDEALWRRTLALNPRSALALSGLGDAQMRAQRIDEGKALYLRAIEWLPPYEPTLLGLGFADLAQGRPEDAIPKLQTYLVTHPESRGGRRFLWQAYVTAGRQADADALGAPEPLPGTDGPRGAQGP